MTGSDLQMMHTAFINSDDKGGKLLSSADDDDDDDDDVPWVDGLPLDGGK